MCMVSNVFDDFSERWKPKIDPYTPLPPNTPMFPFNGVTQQQFNAFKTEMRKELKALRKLLKAAREYDKETGQEDCVDEKKLDVLRDVCKLLEIDPDTVLKS